MIYNFDFKIDILTFDKLSSGSPLDQISSYKMFTESVMAKLLTKATCQFQLFILNLREEYKIRFKNIPYLEYEKEEAIHKLFSMYTWKRQDLSIMQMKDLARERFNELQPYNIRLEVEVNEE